MKWNGKSELKPRTLLQQIVNEVQVHPHWAKDKLVEQWSLGKLDICKQSDSRPISSDTIDLEWIINLYVRNCKFPRRIYRGLL